MIAAVYNGYFAIWRQRPSEWPKATKDLVREERKVAGWRGLADVIYQLSLPLIWCLTSPAIDALWSNAERDQNLLGLKVEYKQINIEWKDIDVFQES